MIIDYNIMPSETHINVNESDDSDIGDQHEHQKQLLGFSSLLILETSIGYAIRVKLFRELLIYVTEFQWHIDKACM
jgi:hypothetical protein